MGGIIGEVLLQFLVLLDQLDEDLLGGVPVVGYVDAVNLVVVEGLLFALQNLHHELCGAHTLHRHVELT